MCKKNKTYLVGVLNTIAFVLSAGTYGYGSIANATDVTDSTFQNDIDYLNSEFDRVFANNDIDNLDVSELASNMFQKIEEQQKQSEIKQLKDSLREKIEFGYLSFSFSDYMNYDHAYKYALQLGLTKAQAQAYASFGSGSMLSDECIISLYNESNNDRKLVRGIISRIKLSTASDDENFLSPIIKLNHLLNRE